MVENVITSVTDKKGNRIDLEMRSDGFFNATKMTEQTPKKQWKHYLDLKNTKEFLEELSALLGVPYSKTPAKQGMLVDITRGARGGIWIHRKVWRCKNPLLQSSGIPDDCHPGFSVFRNPISQMCRWPSISRLGSAHASMFW